MVVMVVMMLVMMVVMGMWVAMARHPHTLAVHNHYPTIYPQEQLRFHPMHPMHPMDPMDPMHPMHQWAHMHSMGMRCAPYVMVGRMVALVPASVAHARAPHPLTAGTSHQPCMHPLWEHPLWAYQVWILSIRQA